LDGFRAVIDGGWIEAVSGRGFTLYCDEEGKNKGLRVNRRATLVLRHLWPRFPDVIMGPAFLCGEPDRRGDDTDVSAEVVQAADETWGTALSAPR
ncbi:MAG: DUF3846 domain-containing protein, partial [Cellulomonadaceae bacterium]|nr:DUF3846 domain-containing protein [Cellulomonadaceae bacterium]